MLKVEVKTTKLTSHMVTSITFLNLCFAIGASLRDDLDLCLRVCLLLLLRGVASLILLARLVFMPIDLADCAVLMTAGLARKDQCFFVNLARFASC